VTNDAAGPLGAEHADVVIVGCGIAGASLAYFLAREGITDVVVVEREAQAAYHASGRSASTLVELDADGVLCRLKIIGGRFLREPPQGFSDAPLLERRGVLTLFCRPMWDAIEEMAPAFADQGLELQLMGAREAAARAEFLEPTAFDGAVFLPTDGVIDVHGLLTSYISEAKRLGVRFIFAAAVEQVNACQGRVSGVEVAVKGERRSIAAAWVVNAAGAWAGELAAKAGAAAIPFKPLRRSLAILPMAEGSRWREWPLVWSDHHRVYFRPEPTGMLFCPMDEEPMEPCDATADDHSIAAGLERLAALAPSLVPRSLGRRWGGLRTFSPDSVPVVGEDPSLGGFFWLAGQGGCGIETSPALGRVGAELIARGSTEVFDAAPLAPERFLGDEFERNIS
jgi:D-arginine dehydrogenase